MFKKKTAEVQPPTIVGAGNLTASQRQNVIMIATRLLERAGIGAAVSNRDDGSVHIHIPPKVP